MMPILLVAYGGASVIGNIVVGRFADRYTIPIPILDLALLAARRARPYRPGSTCTVR